MLVWWIFIDSIGKTNVDIVLLIVHCCLPVCILHSVMLSSFHVVFCFVKGFSWKQFKMLLSLLPKNFCNLNWLFKMLILWNSPSSSLHKANGGMLEQMVGWSVNVWQIEMKSGTHGHCQVYFLWYSTHNLERY